MSDQTLTPPEETIICRVTPWFYRRMGIMSVMFLFFGLYFVYDGWRGYPEENKIAEKKVWFEQTVQKAYDEAKKEGAESLKAWMVKAKSEGWINDLESPPRWDAYAAERSWSSEPKMHSPDAIEQQYYWGGAMLLGTLYCGGLLLLNRNKTFVGNFDHMVMPDGKKVQFSDVFKVDKRKWDNKGLAYAYYRTSESGAEQKAVIDDLKFDGAGKVLERLLAQFSGELIEKLPDEVEPEPEQSETKES